MWMYIVGSPKIRAYRQRDCNEWFKGGKVTQRTRVLLKTNFRRWTSNVADRIQYYVGILISRGS